MQVQEVISMLRWINEGDPRVPFNDSAVEQWHYVLRSVDAAVAKQAVLEHVKQHENIQVTPAAIYKRAGYIKNSRDAGQRAISTTAPVKTEADYRRKIRETPEFMALFDKGRDEGNEIRRLATERRNGTGQVQDRDGWAAA
jgi:hypothetical protein